MKRFLYISLIANLIVLSAAVLIFYFLDKEATILQIYKSVFDKYHVRQSSIFESLPNTPNEIIFLGNGLINQANWNELLENPQVKNRGITGDKTAQVLERLTEVTSSKPAKIFIQVGFDDLYQRLNKEEILENYQKIIDQIKKDSPPTRIYVQSITPVNYTLFGKQLKNEEIIVFNGKLRELAKKNQATYIDLFPALVGDTLTQELKTEYTNDGLHLNGQGYVRWKAILERYLKDE